MGRKTKPTECNIILTQLRNISGQLDKIHDILNRKINTFISPHITNMRKSLAEMEEELQYVEYYLLKNR